MAGEDNLEYPPPKRRQGAAQPSFDLSEPKPVTPPPAQTFGPGFLGTVRATNVPMEALEPVAPPPAQRQPLSAVLSQYGIETPGPRGREGVGGPTEPATPDEFAGASEQLARRQRERADVAAGAQFVGGGGGYKPEEYKLTPELKQAYETALGGVSGVQQQLAAYQTSPERADLAKEHATQLEQAQTDEARRQTRLEDLGVQQRKLAEESAKKIEQFKVDPDRLFGQGGDRALSMFTLGLANIFSNVGEAMQGKAATNAVLGLVRDRIAQDVALQENDYHRMLQGATVRRNGLMDAIQQVGDERKGAEALAKQQSLVYADKLKQIAQGLEDSQARNTLLQAQSQIQEAYGKQAQRLSEVNVEARNRAKAQAAAQAAQDARLRYQQRISAAGVGMTKEEQERVFKALDKATEKGLHVRGEGLRTLRDVVERYPNAAQEARGALGTFWRAVSENKDRGTVESLLANAALENLSEGGRQYIKAYSDYIAPRIRSQAGANVTAGERTLYDPEKYSTAKSIDEMMQSENKRIKDEAVELERGSGLDPNSDARLFLQTQLRRYYAGQTPAAPKPQYATPQGKPLR